MNLPTSFVNYTRHLLGEKEYEELGIALTQEPSVSIRLNPFCFKSEELLINSSLRCEPVPWSSLGCYLEKRPTFTFDPLFHAGCYYAQEASSMFLEQALKKYVVQPAVMLDLCAAPGGKSTHARVCLPEDSLLVANEVNRGRSVILAENLTKWGHPDVVVTNNDPNDFKQLEAFFDVILTDVPCSGEGMFRKDEGAIEEWSEENVEICWQRQRRIISDIWNSLKPGGVLIYSTCTYNTKENEENIQWIEQRFGAEVLPLDIPEAWRVTGSLLKDYDRPVYRFLPHHTRGEGFFLAVLRKPGEDEIPLTFNNGKSKKNKKSAPASVITKEMMAQAESWLNHRECYTLSNEGQTVVVFPSQHLDKLDVLKKNLRVIQAGIPVGENKGKDLSPTHALAMNRLLRKEAFPTEEVSYEQAIAYLRKEAITLFATASRGYVLITYKQIPLGFVKNIGNRANNLYPQEWRIRSNRLPDTITVL